MNFNDPQIWVAVSFILFFILFGRSIWKKFSNFLDNKINDIKRDILTASDLHNKSRDLLSEEIKKFQGLDNQINQILEQGKLKAQDIYNENKDKINVEIEKLEKTSIDKINYIEKQVALKLQAKITERAITLTESFLIEELKDAKQFQTIDQSIKEIETTLINSNSKFIQ